MRSSLIWILSITLHTCVCDQLPGLFLHSGGVFILHQGDTKGLRAWSFQVENDQYIDAETSEAISRVMHSSSRIITLQEELETIRDSYYGCKPAIRDCNLESPAQNRRMASLRKEILRIAQEQRNDILVTQQFFDVLVSREQEVLHPGYHAQILEKILQFENSRTDLDPADADQDADYRAGLLEMIQSEQGRRE